MGPVVYFFFHYLYVKLNCLYICHYNNIFTYIQVLLKCKLAIKNVHSLNNNYVKSSLYAAPIKDFNIDYDKIILDPKIMLEFSRKCRCLFFFSFSSIHFYIYTPAKLFGGHTGISLSVSPFMCPSVCLCVRPCVRVSVCVQNTSNFVSRTLPTV